MYVPRSKTRIIDMCTIHTIRTNIHTSYAHASYMYTCMMHVHMLYDPRSLIMCVRCAHMMCVWCVWYTYLWSWSLILVHACMMHVSKVIDLDTCVYHAGMYDEFWSSILGPYACVMHECIMYISMILMHACIYDAANFVPDERTNGPTNKAILGVGCTKFNRKKTKPMLWVFWRHICYWFMLLSVNKSRGNLKKKSTAFSPPSFMILMSRDDTGILENLLFSRFLF